MRPVHFIHAADLHLGAPFLGVSRDAPAHVTDCLQEAGFTALTRLVDLCERERPDFLLLAGDIHNQEEQSLRARLRLLEACRRLDALGIPVFMVHGNHDPLGDAYSSVRLPDNVTEFGAAPEVHEARGGDGRILALIHGASHASGKEHRNIAAKLQRRDVPCLQIGLLHTTLGAEGERYAPCSMDDFITSGLDYWALGHVHEQRILRENPFVAYPGVTQGLNINEKGFKGCLVVDAAPGAQGFAIHARFAPLGPAVWDVLNISADGAQDLGALETAIQAELARAAATAPPECQLLLVRLVLGGRTGLDAELRHADVRHDLLESARTFTGARLSVWVKDLHVRTTPLIDRQTLAGRSDLVGEIFRTMEQSRDDDTLANGVAAAAAPLFTAARVRRILAPLTSDEIAELAADAENLCLSLLEKN